MNINEEDLRKIVRETVDEALSSYMLMYEMSIHAKDYKSRARGLLPQIAENWCLIYFFKRFNVPTSYIRHWGDELAAHMNNLSSLETKNGKEEKILYKVWDEYDFDKNPLSVFKRISPKFRKEGIDIRAYRKELEDTCLSFVRSTREIVWAIVSNDMFAIDDYIDTIGNKTIDE